MTEPVHPAHAIRREARGASLRPALALMRQTLGFAWTQALYPWALGLGLLALAAGLFFGAVAFAGQGQAVLVTSAALLRFALVVFVAVSCVAVLHGDLGDRWVEMLLGAGLARWQWVGGRLAGCMTFSTLLALAAGLPLVAWSGNLTALLWLVSLAAEMALVAAAAVAAAMSLAGLAVPVVAVMAFYALSRSMVALLAMAAYGAQDGTLLSQAALQVMRALSWLMPRLDTFASSRWLTDGGAAQVDVGLALPLGHAALYGMMLGGVAMVDAYRRRF